MGQMFGNVSSRKQLVKYASLSCVKCSDLSSEVLALKGMELSNFKLTGFKRRKDLEGIYVIDFKSKVNHKPTWW